MMNLTRKSSWYRPLFTENGKMIASINFYKDGKIILSVKRGWLEDDLSKKDTIKLNVLNLQTMNKVILEKDVNFVNKNKVESKNFNERAYDLYIYAKDGMLEFLPEKIKFQTDSKIVYVTPVIVHLPAILEGGQEVEKVQIETNWREEVTEFGKHVQETVKLLEDQGILNKWEEILKKYDLVPKEKSVTGKKVKQKEE